MINTMGVLTVDFKSPDAATQFCHSLKNTGFVVLKNHPLDNQLIQNTYQAWQRFFTSNDKHNFTFNRDTHAGFVSSALSETAKDHTIKDIKEFFHFYPWGPCPETLKHTTLLTYNAMQQLASTLLSWIESQLPSTIQKSLSMPLSDMIHNSARTLLRIIHYPPLVGNEPPSAIRAAAHEDINLITVLPAATSNGLQVQNKQNQWIDIIANPQELVINSGDMLAECTDNYYQATSHRVINPGQQNNSSRLSMPLFLHPSDDVVLSKRHTAKSYCLERFTELGLAPM